MCGIAGIWNLDGHQVDPAAFDRFVDALAHRGPDGRGTHHDRRCGVALGHRLLAIQGGPGQGAQPRSLHERYWITYNGEVFNHAELRAELETLGHTFRTTNDTEVVIAAYAQWGEQCLLRLNGMWAMAIWDALEKTLFVSVDRFAVKSLVYTARSDFFAFASELKAFAWLERFRIEADGAEVNEILTLGGGGTERTWAKGVLRLPAGHSLTLRAGAAPVLRKWWSTLDHLVEPPAGKRAQVERFRELFHSAVGLRLGGNARIAVPLSGGMDSSSVLAAAARIDPQRVANDLPCFFIKKTGVLDEEPFAMSMARHVGASTTVIRGPAQLDVATMEQLIYSFEKFVPQSEGPTSLYRAVRDCGAVVTLDGHGGDELLGGYSCYIEPALADALAGVPNPLRFAELALINRNLMPDSEHFSFTEGWGKTRARVNEAIRHRLNMKVARTFGAGGQLSADPYPADAFPAWFDGLNKELYRDLHYGFLQRVLRTFDYASMANGVEARTPFLDWRLVTYAFSLGSNMKIGAGYTKRILRDAMGDAMPHDVLRRRSKVGFIESVSYFFNPAIVAWMGDIISTRQFQESSLWNGPQIAGVFERWRKAGGSAPTTGKKLLSVAQAHYLITRLGAQQAQAAHPSQAGTGPGFEQTAAAA